MGKRKNKSTSGASPKLKNRIFSARCDEHMYVEIEQECAVTEMTKSDYLRDLWENRNRTIVLDGEVMSRDEIARRAEQIEKIREHEAVENEWRARTLFLMNKSSNNTNQLARKANIAYLNGDLNQQTFDDILEQLMIQTRYMRNAL